ncbi:MAG: hypothetical protein Q9165_007718 [Trypethelium subeluteriae]
MVVPNAKAARATGFYKVDQQDAKWILEETIKGNLRPEEAHRRFEIEIVPSCNVKDGYVGIIDFENDFPQFLASLRQTGASTEDIKHDFELPKDYRKRQSVSEVSIETNAYPRCGRILLTFDADFRGFTQLYPIDQAKYPRITAELEDESQLDLNKLSLQFRNALGSVWPNEAVADGYKQYSEHALRNPFIHPVSAYIFFGVPFFGLYTSDLEAILPDDHPRHTLLKQLGRNNEERVLKVEKFIAKVQDDNAQIINVQESRPTSAIRKIHGKIVVVDPKIPRVTGDAASLNLPSNIEAFLPRDCDHSELSRFSAMEDSDYNSIVNFVKNRLNHCRDQHPMNENSSDSQQLMDVKQSKAYRNNQRPKNGRVTSFSMENSLIWISFLVFSLMVVVFLVIFLSSLTSTTHIAPVNTESNEHLDPLDDGLELKAGIPDEEIVLAPAMPKEIWTPLGYTLGRCLYLLFFQTTLLISFFGLGAQQLFRRKSSLYWLAESDEDI